MRELTAWFLAGVLGSLALIQSYRLGEAEREAEAGRELARKVKEHNHAAQDRAMELYHKGGHYNEHGLFVADEE